MIETKDIIKAIDSILSSARPLGRSYRRNSLFQGNFVIPGDKLEILSNLKIELSQE